MHGWMDGFIRASIECDVQHNGATFDELFNRIEGPEGVATTAIRIGKHSSYSLFIRRHPTIQ